MKQKQIDIVNAGKTFSQIYNQGIYRLADMYVKQFEKLGDEFFKSIVVLKSVRSALCEIYRVLVKKGHCTPIKRLELPEKEALFQEAKRLGATDKKTIIQTCKALHALGSYVQIEN